MKQRFDEITVHDKHFPEEGESFESSFSRMWSSSQIRVQSSFFLLSKNIRFSNYTSVVQQGANTSRNMKTAVIGITRSSPDKIASAQLQFPRHWLAVLTPIAEASGFQTGFWPRQFQCHALNALHVVHGGSKCTLLIHIDQHKKNKSLVLTPRKHQWNSKTSVLHLLDSQIDFQ